jgi:hypothetical protein
MIEHGLYILKPLFFDLVTSLGGDCDTEGGGRRPVYCCMKDKVVEGLYWAIPTSNISHRNQEQLERINKYMALGDDDLRSCYYHKARTTMPAVYKISSCFPLIEKYVDHAFVSNGVHVVMQRKNDIAEIERKLKRILAFEFSQPNYFPQHISSIKDFLVAELKK